MKKVFVSPLSILSLWILLVFVNFIKIIPEPSIIGYLWKAELALAVLLFATLIHIAISSKTNPIEFAFGLPELRFLSIPFALFVVWSGLSVFWAYSWRNALHYSLLWACYFLFYLLFRQAVKDTRIVDLTIKITGIVVFAMGMACIIEYLGDAGQITQVFTFKWYKYGEVFLSLLPIFLALTIHKNRRNSILAGLVVLSSWFVVLLTTSRTALISASTGIVVFYVLLLIFQDWKRYWKKSLAILTLLIFAFALTQVSFSGKAEDTTVKRLAGNGDISQSSLKVRYLFWGIALEGFKRNPLIGVGGDNYLVIYKDARKDFAKNNPESELAGLHEDVLPERAHNEYLQILSELGIIGFAMFLCFICGVFFLVYRKRKQKISLITIGAIAGLFAFLVSSLASAYSFRVTVNGITFFFLLSIAVYGLVKREDALPNRKTSQITTKLIIMIGIACCILMIGFSIIRGTSLMYLQMAMQAKDTAESQIYFERAIWLDSEDGLIRFQYASNLANSKKPLEAIPQLKIAIEKGIATSVAFYSLATTEILAGKPDDAEKTFLESLKVFPKSVFLRTAYASFLFKSDRANEATQQYDEALRINEKQTRSWLIAQKEGLSKLALSNYYDRSLLTVDELYPAEAPLAVLNYERNSENR